MFSCKPKPVPTEEQKAAQRLDREIQLLEFYGIKFNVDFRLQDVVVQYNGNEHLIHTFIGGDMNLPTALLLHGYGGSNVHYARVYKALIKEFHVISIDLPGMGFCSKENININNKEETLAYFLGSIFNFIQQVLPNQQFILIGHSFGGYIASHLLVNYPQCFSQVFLLSPAGCTYYDDAYIDKMQKGEHLNSTVLKWVMSYAKKKWQQQMTPQQLSQTWYGGWFVKRYLSKRMALKGKELELWTQYVDELLSLPIGSEKALYLMLDFPRVIARGCDSIEYLLTYHHAKLTNIPISFYFGEKGNDWMDHKGAESLNERYPFIEVKFIEHAGHQLNFENPNSVGSLGREITSIRKYWNLIIILMFSCGSRESVTEAQKKSIRARKEEELLEFYGIRAGVDFHVYDFPVQYGGFDHTIHVFYAGQQHYPTLLLIHGYGGSHVHYSRMYPHLIKNFQVISIDIPGMGLCSKENIDIKDKESAIEFFMGTIDHLITQLVQKNKKIILVGHSFGGYIASNLVVRFPERFSQLFLLSPAGTTYYNEERFTKISTLSHVDGTVRRYFMGLVKSKWWDQMVTPKQINDKWYGRLFIKTYLSRRMALQGAEYKLWKAYIDEMLTLPDGSEKALYMVLNFPRVIAKGTDSIEYIFEQNMQKIRNIPIRFYFGDQDWMDQEGARRLAQNPNIDIRIIPEAGHQLNFENPLHVAQSLHQDYLHLNMYKEMDAEMEVHNQVEQQIQFQAFS